MHSSFSSSNPFSSAIHLANPKVFFDLNVDGKDAGRITFELYADTVPKTVSLTIELCLYPPLG